MVEEWNTTSAIRKQVNRLEEQNHKLKEAAKLGREYLIELREIQEERQADDLYLERMDNDLEFIDQLLSTE